MNEAEQQERSKQDIERRMQDAIQRALNTPPKPFTKPKKGDSKKKPSRKKKPAKYPMSNASVSEIGVLNGRIQVSSRSGDSKLGLLVERGALFGGVLLTTTQARDLARVLLRRARFHEADDTSAASRLLP